MVTMISLKILASDCFSFFEMDGQKDLILAALYHKNRRVRYA